MLTGDITLIILMVSHNATPQQALGFSKGNGQMAKSTTLIHLEEQLKWAYQGSYHLNGRIDWGQVNRLRQEIKEEREGR